MTASKMFVLSVYLLYVYQCISSMAIGNRAHRLCFMLALVKDRLLVGCRTSDITAINKLLEAA